jgi:hypothetical protein
VWNELLTDFRERALRLAAAPRCDDATCTCEARSVIDESICWQMCGDQWLIRTEGDARSLADGQDLHLPELYSGAPWSFQEESPDWFPDTLRGKWLAIVTTNPSIAPDEPFPTLRHWKGEADTPAIEHYFSQRFAFDAATNLLPNGRSQSSFGGDNGLCIWNHAGAPVRACATWRNIESALAEAVELAGHGRLPALLGTVAMLVDAVPWKFKNWSGVDGHRRWKRRDSQGGRIDRRDLFIAAARDYCRWTLETHAPPLLIVTGGAWQPVASLLGTPAANAAFHDDGHWPLVGTGMVRVVRAYHPSTWWGANEISVRRPLVQFLADWFRT